jgi:hypothetical protein
MTVSRHCSQPGALLWLPKDFSTGHKADLCYPQCSMAQTEGPSRNSCLDLLFLLAFLAPDSFLASGHYNIPKSPASFTAWFHLPQTFFLPPPPRLAPTVPVSQRDWPGTGGFLSPPATLRYPTLTEEAKDRRYPEFLNQKELYNPPCMGHNRPQPLLSLRWAVLRALQPSGDPACHPYFRQCLPLPCQPATPPVLG